MNSIEKWLVRINDPLTLSILQSSPLNTAEKKPMLEKYIAQSPDRMRKLGPQLAELLNCTYGQLRLSLMPAPLQALAIAYHGKDEVAQARAVKRAMLRI